MIELLDNLLIGKGRFRSCYQHPYKDNLVIKIQHHQSSDVKGKYSSHNRELAFYKKITGAHDAFPELISIEDTNFGDGLVFKKIVNNDGSSAHHLFPNGKYNGGLSIDVYQKIIRIMKQLEKDAILSCAVNPENLLLVNGEYGVMLISCDAKLLENKELIPVSKFSCYFMRKKIKRRNERLLRFYASFINES